MLDVWIIGPTLVYAAYRLPESEKGLKQALFVFGVGTIGYNYLNWARFNRLTRASS